MGYHHKKAGILTCTLLASVVLASCSFAPSGTGPEGSPIPKETGDTVEAASGSDDAVNSAVDFDHELDQYEPKKDHYNFYFTYKIVHPWWDAVALGMEDAQRKFLE